MLNEVKVSFESLSYFSAFPFARKLALCGDFDDGTDKSPKSMKRLDLFASRIADMPRLDSREFNSSVMMASNRTSVVQTITKSDTTNQRTRFLAVYVWADDLEEFDKFITSISTFKHIEFLKLDLEDMPELTTSAVNMAIKPLIEMCSNLKGLNLEGDEYEIELSVLKEIGRNLQYLKLNKVDDIQVSQQLNDMHFTNLRQLVQGKAMIVVIMQCVLYYEVQSVWKS